MATVEFRDVGKVFDNGFVAVRDFSLKIEDGELMVLVGPSGCGKSTLLRILAGLDDPSGGDVLIDGEVVNEVPPRDRDIAMVFQSYALYPHLTVRENIEFGLRLHHVDADEIERRLRETSELLGLDELLDRRPKQLSGGQRQRVAMGRALVREPKVFLMDEPLSNLDAKLRVRMRSEIGFLQQRLGTTMLYVTHDQVEAMTMGDRVAVMRQGAILQVGTPKEIYNHPVDSFVAAFVGSPSMNLAEATVVSTTDAADATPGEAHATPGEAHATPGEAHATPGEAHATPAEDTGNRAVWLQLGSQRLRLSCETLSEFPALNDLADTGDVLIMGIRPEDMEDAQLVRGGHPATLRAQVHIVEELGAQTMVHFSIDARSVDAEGRADFQLGSALTSDFVAAFSPRTTVSSNDEIEVSLDMSRMHFFDRVTGLSMAKGMPQ